MRLELGIDTCFAVKRWPRVEDWAPIVRDRLGLTLVQHSLDLVDLEVDDGPAVGAAIEGHGLVLHSTFTGLALYSENLLLAPDEATRDVAEERLAVAVEWTAEAGGRATGGHVGAFSVPDWRDPQRRQARWAGMRAALDRLARVARSVGLEYLLVENLAAAREPSTMAMIRDLVSDGDAEKVPIRLCLDVGHMCVPGTSDADRDPYAWLRQLGTVAPVVQLQQSDAQGDHHWPFTPDRNAAGRIEADRVIESLGEGGVQSTALILEVIPAFEQDDDEVIDDLVASVAYWQEALTRLGVLG